MPEAAPRLRRNVPRWVTFLVLLAVFAVVWTSFEAAARRTGLKFVLDVYRDPDHRLPPNDPHIGTNGDGLRCSLEANEIPDQAVRILFLGDSYVYGVQVDRDRALPQLFEARLREVYPDRAIHVVNGAWPSASPLLALRLLQDFGEKYRPQVVVYGFDMSDFRDDLMYRNLFERRGLYRLSAFAPATLWTINQAVKAVGSEPLYRRFFRMPSDRFFVVNQILDKSADNMETSWSYIEAMNRYCVENLGASFNLVVLPRNFQYSDRESPLSWETGQYTELGDYVLEPFRFFSFKARSAAFKMSSLLPAFRDSGVFPTCFAGDPHWTPAGTELAARAMVRIAVDQEWLGEIQSLSPRKAITRSKTDRPPSASTE